LDLKAAQHLDRQRQLFYDVLSRCQAELWWKVNMSDILKWWQRFSGSAAAPKANPPTKERVEEVERRLQNNPLMNAMVGEAVFASMIATGDEMRGSGDMVGALHQFTNAAKYAIEQGNGQSPDVVTFWRKHRAVAASRMARCLQAVNDLEGARKLFDICLTIFKACAADDPDDSDTAWDVFLAHKNLAEVLDALNLPAEAASHYEVLINAWQASERLPASAAEHFLSVSGGLRLAEIRRSKGDFAGAREALVQCRLAMNDCGNAFPEAAWIFMGSPDSPRHAAMLEERDPHDTERLWVELTKSHAKAQRELDALN
jgi:tetratricopeptide (TPR) repeat protein